MLEFKDYPSTDTPINATNLNNMQKLLVDLIYPIGTYYDTSDTNFDPNNSWGGTWVLETDGTVLVSKSSTNGSNFNANLGTIVGTETHTLSINEMPSHQHTLLNQNSSGSSATWSSYAVTATTGTGYTHNVNTNFAGGGQAHNNVQPSKIVNRWHRTA